MFYLEINFTGVRKDNLTLDKPEITIGRADENDIVLQDYRVSRKHAKIIKKSKAFYVHDLESSNGTQLNGKYVKRAKLKQDDEIQIGTSTIIFRTGEIPIESPSDTFELDGAVDFEKWSQHTIDISPEESCNLNSQDLLNAVGRQKPGAKTVGKVDEIHALERMNKVLFVLYEISRQLSTTSDMKEIMVKIMDLIFKVIDADYGFLVLTGETETDSVIPIVVKSKVKQAGGAGELRASRTLINKVVTEKVALLTSNAMTDARFGAAESLITKQMRSAMCVPLWGKDKIIGAIQLHSTRAKNIFTKDSLELLKTIGCQMAMVIEQARLNDQIRREELMRSRLERFHSPQIIEMILKKNQDTIETIMEPKDLTSTILFTDIVGFTGMSEKMSPREVNMLLNQHFSLLTDVLFKYDGTLDKFLGDGLMAIFGTPIEKKDDAERAVQAALEIRRAFTELKDNAEKDIQLKIRIGINTGRVVAGNIGSPKRMDYTVIGDAVNIAKRLESIAVPNQILIGPDTYKQVKGKFNLNKVGSKKLKGRSAEILAYEVLDNT